MKACVHTYKELGSISYIETENETNSKNKRILKTVKKNYPQFPRLFNIT